MQLTAILLILFILCIGCIIPEMVLVGVWKNTDGRAPCKMVDELLLLVQGLLTLWIVLTTSGILLTILDCQKLESYVHLSISSLSLKRNKLLASLVVNISILNSRVSQL